MSFQKGRCPLFIPLAGRLIFPQDQGIRRDGADRVRIVPGDLRQDQAAAHVDLEKILQMVHGNGPHLNRPFACADIGRVIRIADAAPDLRKVGGTDLRFPFRPRAQSGEPGAEGIDPFPVTEDLYAEIQTALSDNRPLQDCPFYEKLQDLASAQISLEDYLPDWLEKPDPEEYDDEEFFEEELASYEEQREEYLDVLTIEECAIDDPGDLKRLNDRFRSLVFPDWTVYAELDIENEDVTRHYRIHLHLTEDGAVKEIEVTAEGLTSESLRSAYYADCYPDYNLIADELQKEYERQNA